MGLEAASVHEMTALNLTRVQDISTLEESEPGSWFHFLLPSHPRSGQKGRLAGSKRAPRSWLPLSLEEGVGWDGWLQVSSCLMLTSRKNPQCGFGVGA